MLSYFLTVFTTGGVSSSDFQGVEVNEYRRTYERSGLVYILYLVEHLSGSLCSVPVVKYGASQNLLSLGASQCN